jgi:type 1 glutamine amidotransferase
MQVLVVGENQFDFHRLEDCADHLRQILDAVGEVTVTTDRSALGAESLANVDVLIDVLTEPPVEHADGVVDFVRNGGGFVGLHSAADVSSFVDEPADTVAALLGGRFVGHPEQSTFGVRIQDAEHPITAGVADFEVYDEPYDIRMEPAVETNLLADMEHPDLDGTPVAWTRSEGDGRVFYCSLGHTEEAREHESFRRLLRQGVEWAGDASASK